MHFAHLNRPLRIPRQVGQKETVSFFCRYADQAHVDVQTAATHGDVGVDGFAVAHQEVFREQQVEIFSTFEGLGQRSANQLLDPVPGGYLALYQSWGGPLGPNESFEVRLFSCAGRPLVGVPLNPLLSRRDQLEAQDVRHADGVLYLDEACQSYSREAGGCCSALAAVDAFSGRRRWRTGPLVSNDVIRPVGDYVVAGHG
jgi:hypothetical protein